MSNKTTANSVYVDAIVTALTDAAEPLTIAAISEKAGMEIKPGHIVAALRKGLIVKADEEVEEIRPATKKVNTYKRGSVTLDAFTADHPKAKFNETAIALVNTLADEPATLEELSKKAGIDFKSGHINSLTRLGIAEKGEEKAVETTKKVKVGAYKLAAE